MAFIPSSPLPFHLTHRPSTCSRFPFAVLPSTPNDESSSKRPRGRPRKSPSSNSSQPKRRRGRPKKSTNQTAPTPVPRPISPKRQFIVSDPDNISSSTTPLPIAPPDPDDLDEAWIQAFPDDSKDSPLSTTSAPNGIPNSANSDLLPELLSVLSKAQFQASQPRSLQQKHVHQLLHTCFYDSVSMHRSSGRESNLKPFQKRKVVQGVCQTCQGKGMTVCEYCKGQGFVDLGKDACKFHQKFGDNLLMKPQLVMGTIYFCPLCGGLQKERCVGCLGTGIDDPEEGEKVEGAADDVRSGMGVGGWSFEELMIREKDRIEVGLDGTVILRAKGRKKKKKKIDEEKKVDDDVVNVVKNEVSLSPSKRRVIENRTVRKTTDFVNTTDYQVGRRLRKRQSKSKQNRDAMNKKEDQISDE